MSDENVRDMIFDCVIIDEAAKATTPELLVSIIKAKKIVLVGDQNQLPPYVETDSSLLAIELAQNPRFRLFDILFESLPDTHKHFLPTQYRMHSTIGHLISNVFYDGKIFTGIDDSKRQHCFSMFADKAIVWIDTSKLAHHEQEQKLGTSFQNVSEARIVVHGTFPAFSPLNR